MFGKDTEKYRIEDTKSGTVYTVKAITKDESEATVGYITLKGNVIIKFMLTDDKLSGAGYEMMRFICKKYDEINQPIMVDENGISTSIKHFFENFGFKGGEDSFLTRLPFAIIPLDYAQPNKLLKKTKYSKK